MKQFLVYQHNVQQFFIRHIGKYDGILIPFSIAASFPSATYGFARALLAKDPGKEFALDPRSALFQKAWNRANVREPHRRMAAILGGPFVTAGLERNLVPGDLAPAGVIGQVTNSCLTYQTGFRVLQEERRKLEKYRKLLGIDAIPEIGNPQRLIPPYFQFETLADPWYGISMRCTEAATLLYPPDQLTPVIHFTSWTRVADWPALCQRVAECGVHSVFLYPNNFKEHDALQEELNAYTRCLDNFRAAHVVPLVLHGGYFAIMLAKKGLEGFGNGVGYGEWRDSGYHRGGTAEVRIYIPKLHRLLDAPSAQSLISRNPEYFASDSELLAEYLLAGRPLTEVGLQESLDHFMECRYQEMEFVRTQERPALVAELQDTITALGQVGPLELAKYGASLQRWMGAISL